jgi:pimeloyl-ACP methyl ester carboxylesterase
VTLDEESELDFSVLELAVFQHSAWPQQAERRRVVQWSTLLSSTTAKDDLRDPAGLTVELIRQVQVPTQAIYGEFSSCLPSLKGLQAHLPNLEATVLPGLGHFFPITRPELFLEQVKSFHAAPARPPEGPAAEESPSPVADPSCS